MDNYQVDIDQLANIGNDYTAMDSTNFHNNMNNCSYSSSMGKWNYLQLKSNSFWKEAQLQITAAPTQLSPLLQLKMMYSQDK